MTDEKPPDKVIERITKLLEVAERHAAEAQRNPDQREHFMAEAEVAAAMAQRLMTQHSIEITMLRAAGKTAHEITREPIKVARRWFAQDTALLDEIARANDCRIFYLSPHGPFGLATVVGYADDVENVKLLYGSLLIQLASLTRGMKAPLDPWGRGPSDNVYQRSFRYGFAAGIGARLAEARATVVSEAAKTERSLLPALVEKEAAVEAALPDDLRTTRGGAVGDMAAAAAGYRAAERVDIGNAAVSAG